MEFQVGDIVDWLGAKGRIVRIDRSTAYSIIVDFEESDSYKAFTADGRHYRFHTTPSLKLIERPKKKVKKVLKGWVNEYHTRYSSIYSTKEDADSFADKATRIACIEINQEYEVEE